MRAADYQSVLRELPVGDVAALSRGGGIVVLAPHPDDESLGCGGTIALARRQGVDVRVVILSDGAGSHPHSRSHPPARLRTLRRWEALRAAHILGLEAEAVTFLNLPDTAVPAKGPEAEEVAGRIAALARECAAGVMLATSALDPHCDHAAAAAIAALACGLLPDCAHYAYPIWIWSMDEAAELAAPSPTGLRLDIGVCRDLKRRAIFAHASQTGSVIADDPTAFRLAPAMIDLCAGPYETFVEVNP